MTGVVSRPRRVPAHRPGPGGDATTVLVDYDPRLQLRALPPRDPDERPATAPVQEEAQIEVIDDCSTRDDPAVVGEACGRGRVSYFRQPAMSGPRPPSRRASSARAESGCTSFTVTTWWLKGSIELSSGPPESTRRSGSAFCRSMNVDAAGDAGSLFRARVGAAGGSGESDRPAGN